MEHIKVNDNYVKTLIEQAEWSKVDVKPVVEKTEAEAVVEEATGSEETFSEEEIEAALSEMSDEELEELAESLDSEASVYACPLCECELENELSEEIISEHLDFVMNLLADGLEELYEAEESEELAEEEVVTLEDRKERLRQIAVELSK
tara:strand:+ start:194 stop:640 length:447 start_codon:yes stop_codon:yes gene_type:complete